jgi:hypothetical protein
MAFCPPIDGNHPSRLLLVGDFAHPLLTSLSFLSKSIEGSPGKISCHQMACHFPSLPITSQQARGSAGVGDRAQ